MTRNERKRVVRLTRKYLVLWAILPRTQFLSSMECPTSGHSPTQLRDLPLWMHQGEQVRSQVWRVSPDSKQIPNREMETVDFYNVRISIPKIRLYVDFLRYSLSPFSFDFHDFWVHRRIFSTFSSTFSYTQPVDSFGLGDTRENLATLCIEFYLYWVGNWAIAGFVIR